MAKKYLHINLEAVCGYFAYSLNWEYNDWCP